jgi:hypothetical protein
MRYELGPGAPSIETSGDGARLQDGETRLLCTDSAGRHRLATAREIRPSFAWPAGADCFRPNDREHASQG